MNSKAIKPRKVLFVIHDLGVTGATLVLYRYIEFALRHKQIQPVFLVCGEGPMEGKLESLGKIYRWKKKVRELTRSRKIRIKLGWEKYDAGGYSDVISSVVAEKPDLIYGNTLLSLPVLRVLRDATGIKVICHSHELNLAWRTYGVKTEYFGWVDHWIANSMSSKLLLVQHGVHEENIDVCYPPVSLSSSRGIRDSRYFTVGTSGMAIGRKGADLFIQLAFIYRKLFPEDHTKFVWVGKVGDREYELAHDIELGNISNLSFAGLTEDPGRAYSSFDLFVSVSKEESFGLACAEAGSLGVPLMGFEKTGGVEELIRSCQGVLIPYLDLEAMALKIHELRNDSHKLMAMGAGAKEQCKTFTLESTASKWMYILSKF